jgi:hypothetical protein
MRGDLPDFILPGDAFTPEVLAELKEHAFRLQLQALAQQLVALTNKGVEYVSLTRDIFQFDVALKYQGHEGIFRNDGNALNCADRIALPPGVQVTPNEVAAMDFWPLINHFGNKAVILRQGQEDKFLRNVYGDRFEQYKAEVLARKMASSLPSALPNIHRPRF